MSEIPRYNSLEQSVYTLKNEGQKGKTVPAQKWVQVG
jgi:hypothetical protein